jgi:hypothetical protein
MSHNKITQYYKSALPESSDTPQPLYGLYVAMPQASSQQINIVTLHYLQNHLSTLKLCSHYTIYKTIFQHSSCALTTLCRCHPPAV